MRARAGVTWVEVVVAVTLCGAGLAVVSTGLAAAVRAEGYAADHSRAARLLDLVLARIDAQVLDLADQDGDFTEEGAPEVRWEIETGTTTIENLQELTVTVRWDEPGGEREVSVVRQVFVDPLAGGTR